MSVRSSPCVIFANSSLAQNKGTAPGLIPWGWEFFQFQKAAEEIFSAAVSMPEGRNLSPDELEAARRSVVGSLRTTLDPGRLEEYYRTARSPARGSRQSWQRQSRPFHGKTWCRWHKRVQLDSVYTLQGKGGG